MRYWVRKSVKSGRCVASNQYYKSNSSDDVFDIIPTELKFVAKICENLARYFEYINEHKRILKKNKRQDLKNIELLI